MKDYAQGARDVFDSLQCSCYWRRKNTRKSTDPDRRMVCRMTSTGKDCCFDNCLGKSAARVQMAIEERQ